MRSLWIATVATAALLPTAASAQAVSGANSNAGATFSHAMAGRGGAFSHAQSGPVVRPMPAPMPAPMPHQGRWTGPRNGPGGMQPVGPRNGPGGIQPRPHTQPGWIDTRGGIYQPNRQPGWIDTRGGIYRPNRGGATSGSWSSSQSHGWTGPRGSWNGQRWTGGSRWGGRVDGRWHSGYYAPGGWSAYRRPTRGWTLPSYWFAPSYFINDFAFYGLASPPVGYNWSRYYDDAVLVDGRGRVFDSVGGINWDRYDGGYAYDDYGYDDGSYDDGETYYADGADDDYGPRGRGDRRRRDDGVGGAVIGGVLGGVAGNVIAGRGDKLAGTLIGAGAGAIAGTAIDRAEDRGRDRRLPPPPDADRGAPYGYPDGGPIPPRGYAPGPGGYGPGPGGYGPPPIVTHGGGYETRVYTSGGYAGYGYYGGTTTTVTVLPTTTTTTETITVYDTERTRTWRAPVKRTKVLRRTPSKILSRSCNC